MADILYKREKKKRGAEKQDQRSKAMRLSSDQKWSRILKLYG